MNFGDALQMLKADQKICRLVWTNDEYLLLTTFVPDDGSSNILSVVKSSTNPFFVERWQPTQTEILAEDWMVIG